VSSGASSNWFAVLKIGLVPLLVEGEGVGDGEALERSGPDATGLSASSPVQAASRTTATEHGTATRANLDTTPEHTERAGSSALHA
jgi:hypothetical protein